jgi:hypothetical protein
MEGDKWIRQRLKEPIDFLNPPIFWKLSASPDSKSKNNEKKTRKNLLYIEDTPK